MGHRCRVWDWDKFSPLHRAVQDGNFPEVRKLVGEYGLTDWPDRFGGYSSLSSALRYGYTDIARYLIKNGAAVNNKNNKDGKITLRETTPLHRAVSNGYPDIVKLLLARYADVNAQDNEGQTPLHRAVMADFPRGGRSDVIQCLLDHGASVNALNLYGTTPLHEACSRNALATVTRLVARGASIHSEVPPLETRFQHQRLYVSLESLKLKSAASFSNFTPLHFAVRSGAVDIAAYLVRRGAHVIIEDKPSPLYLAVQKEDISMIQTLTGGRYLPVLLNLSILNERRDILEYLLEHGADINPTESLHPLHFAAATGNTAVCEFLLGKGAYIDAKQTLSKDQVHQQTSLLCNSALDLKSLSLDGLGKTALHFATENRRDAVVDLLLQHGADVDSTDDDGQTALHIACRVKLVSRVLVDSLLNYGSDVNIVDLRGQTLFDVQPTTNSWQLKLHLCRHFVKLIAAGLYVDKQLEALIPSSSVQFRQSCVKEITELRSEKILETNLYEIFNKTLTEMAFLAKNKVAAEVLKSREFTNRFPIYSHMLKARLVRGESRAKLLDEVPITYHEYQGLCLPYLCVKKILDYLSDGDLKRLNDACTLQGKFCNKEVQLH